MKFIFILSALLISISSCRKGISFSKEIVNTTEFDLSFYFYNNSKSYNADSVIVKAYKSLVYYQTEIRENEFNDPNNLCNPQIQPNDFLVKVSDNKVLIKNISTPQNWDCLNENGTRKASFTVGYEDIQ